jgi:hypothetical protein
MTPLSPVKERKSIFEIPLGEGMRLTRAWAEKGKFYKAFLLDASELRDVLAEKKASYIRVYFGWDDEQEPGRNERLIMVPADDLGNDMLPDSSSLDDATLESSNSNVFDFTLPCPPTCDPKSPLFQAASAPLKTTV